MVINKLNSLNWGRKVYFVLAFILGTSAAQGQTIEELKAKIDQLAAQVLVLNEELETVKSENQKLADEASKSRAAYFEMVVERDTLKESLLQLRSSSPKSPDEFADKMSSVSTKPIEAMGADVSPMTMSGDSLVQQVAMLKAKNEELRTAAAKARSAYFEIVLERDTLKEALGQNYASETPPSMPKVMVDASDEKNTAEMSVAQSDREFESCFLLKQYAPLYYEKVYVNYNISLTGRKFDGVMDYSFLPTYGKPAYRAYKIKGNVISKGETNTLEITSVDGESVDIVLIHNREELNESKISGTEKDLATIGTEEYPLSEFTFAVCK